MFKKLRKDGVLQEKDSVVVDYECKVMAMVNFFSFVFFFFLLLSGVNATAQQRTFLPHQEQPPYYFKKNEKRTFAKKRGFALSALLIGSHGSLTLHCLLAPLTCCELFALFIGSHS